MKKYTYQNAGSMKMLLLLVNMALAFGAGKVSAGTYSGNIPDGIIETMQGENDLYITYEGGTLSSETGASMDITGTAENTGNLFVGYNSDGTENALSGRIINSLSHGGTVSILNKGSGDVNVLSAANVSCSFTAFNIQAQGNAYMRNSGTIYSVGGDYLSALIMKTENASTVILENTSSITSGGGMGIELMNASGAVSATNYAEGSISGRTQGVSIRSLSGDITVDNFGSIASAAGGGVNVDSSGSVSITNSGTITALQSNAIYVGSNVNGGFVRNSGSINAADAIIIQGSGIRLELDKEGMISGSIYIAPGNGNTLYVEPGANRIAGNVNIQGSTFEMAIINGSDYSQLSAEGIISINETELLVDVIGMELEAGSSFLILQSDTGITGSFAGITEEDYYVTQSPFHEYVFSVRYTGNEVYLDTVSILAIPEASTLGVWAAISSLAFAMTRKRKPHLN